MKDRNVIFLDVDGVLNSRFWNECHEREISDGNLIDEKMVSILSDLVKKTEARVVLHSGWRFWFDENMQATRKEAQRLVEICHQYEITLDCMTPDLTTEEIRRTKKFSLVKAKEILLWLKQHENTRGWVVLDDLALHDEIVRRHQVMTDSNVGLTVLDCDQAIEILSKTVD